MSTTGSDETYSGALRPDVSQGDIFRDVAFVRVEATGEEVTTTTARYTALLLTHDCQYDKPLVDFVLMARIRRLDELTGGSQGNVRRYRTTATFYLPELPPELPESFVDFYHIVPVSKAEVARLAAADQRIASLSDLGRLGLQRQIAIYFGLKDVPPLE